jgi:hypothetical protein
LTQNFTGQKIFLEMPIKNTDRAVGCMLSHNVTKKLGPVDTLAEDTIHIKFEGRCEPLLPLLSLSLALALLFGLHPSGRALHCTH